VTKIAISNIKLLKKHKISQPTQKKAVAMETMSYIAKLFFWHLKTNIILGKVRKFQGKIPFHSKDMSKSLLGGGPLWPE